MIMTQKRRKQNKYKNRGQMFIDLDLGIVV